MINDVAIIGAGPAGAWAAYRLARAGARVVLFDGSHPREKPCGGGVTGRALELVADAPELRQMPAVVVREARFVDPDGRSATVPLHADGLSPSSTLIVAARADFDARLFAAAAGAGAEIVRARVVDVAADDSGARVVTRDATHRAALVVGADGANSLVRRRLARPFCRAELSIATGFFVHGATGDEVVVAMIDDPPGYLWSFPRPSHLAVGICAQADAGIGAVALRARAHAWIARTGVARDARLEPYSWPIPSLGARDLARLDVAGPRWLLVGDAAGLVDPITREGIYFALLSGEWAAEAIRAASGDPARRYAARVRRQIVPELARAARLKAGFFRPRFARLLIDALRHSAAVRTVMADLVAGRQSYATLKWRLVRTFEVGLAWQLLRTEGQD